MDHDSMAQSPAPRPLCGCKKQRTDCGMRLGAARLGRYCRAIFSPSEVRFRVRQRRELGIERFRREGLCTEESDAATLPPGDVLPRTDADTASDEESDAATLPPIHCPLCTEHELALAALSLMDEEGPLPPIHCPRCAQHEQALAAVSLMDEEGPLPPIHCPRCAQHEQALAALSLMDEEGPLPHIPYHRCTPGEHALAVLSVNKEEPLPPNHTS
ncbi:hypothetical protein Q4I30_000406 [Leishmania utingensis]|uniref:Uncharacterized protein n=1 Tax=Leishmania utingensis TaxID=653362 RepID=A0AAW3B2L0_9TRYP